MQIHHEAPADVVRYLKNRQHIALEDREGEFENYMGYITRFCTVDADTQMLEIGTGLGTFPLFCKMKGISCLGLEISPHLIEAARNLGATRGIEPNIKLGNIEDSDIGRLSYDVIVAYAVFEHVEHWERALQKVYEALKPGGVFLFSSTNKFALTSGEYPPFPLYGWMPDSWRFRFRVWRHGADIMKLGIDFNQFTYPQLRRVFQGLGFSKVLDRVELAEPRKMSWPKRSLIMLAKRVRPLRSLFLLFSGDTIFVCVK